MLQLCSQTRGKQDAATLSGQLSQPDINVHMQVATTQLLMQYWRHQHIAAATNNVLRQADILLVQSAGKAPQLLMHLW